MSQDRDQRPKRLCVGRITAPHGVRGLVRIRPCCEDVALLEQAEDYKITVKSSAGPYLLAAVAGVHDRDGAAALNNTELFVTRDKLPAIDDKDVFYCADLIGLPVLDEGGAALGRVRAVENYGAGDLLAVRLHAGPDILLPFTGEYVAAICETVTIRNYQKFLA